jgi:hypothetical protein
MSGQGPANEGLNTGLEVWVEISGGGRKESAFRAVEMADAKGGILPFFF